MALTIRYLGRGSFQLLYGSLGLQEGVTVTGYLIYPDRTKSDVFTFDELGDGVYAITIPYERQTMEFDDKYGLLVKENGVPKHFEVIRMIN